MRMLEVAAETGEMQRDGEDWEGLVDGVLSKPLIDTAPNISEHPFYRKYPKRP